MNKNESGKIDMILNMLERHIDKTDEHHEEVNSILRKHGEDIATLTAENKASVKRADGVMGHIKYIWGILLSILGISVT